MRFLLDENVDARLGAFLVQQGHDVKTIAIDYPQALADNQVLAIALRERRILVTHDRDFGELIFRERRPHAGVILLRMRGTLDELQTRMLQVIVEFEAHLTQFVVVTERLIRVR